MATSLHCHSDYSTALLGFPDSINKTEELIDSAYNIGLNGVAITDHEGFMGHIRALKYHRSKEYDRPFKLILGNEIYLMSEHEDLINRGNVEGERVPYYHFLLNALDNEGHKQLRELSSRAWIRAYTSRGLMRNPTYYSDIEDIIKPNKGHVVASSACLGGYLPKLVYEWIYSQSDDTKLKIHNFILWCIDMFGEDNFYFEIQPCKCDNKDQSLVNETIWMLKKAYGLKAIVTTDAHYLSKDTAFVHKTFLNSKDGEREVDSFYSTAYLMNEEEIHSYLIQFFEEEDIKEMLDTTDEICTRVKGYDFEQNPMIPQLPLEKMPDFKIMHIYKDYYDEFEEFKYYAHTNNIYDQYFFYRIEVAIKLLVEAKGKDVRLYIDRLDKEFHELRLISEAFNDHMAGYYSSMAQIIDLIWETDSLSMPARGSGAGFLVCYLLEISQIDPVPLGDYFPYWRHLSAERGVEIADIDNDSQSNRREDIIEAIRQYWGADRVLNVSTSSTITSKTAVERACKGLGISDDVAGYLKSLIPVERGSIWGLKDCLYGDKEKGRKRVVELANEINKHEHLLECALAFEGLIIGRGIHASGILIGNEPYTNTIACMRSPNGVLCSCYDLHDAEYCGQTKVDMLTIKASDKIRKTMDLLLENGHMEWQGSLKATYWKYLHPDVLNYTEPKMWNMIKEVYSVFQFDTATSVKALNQVKPKSVMDLSATNSLLRLMGQDGKETPIEKYARYKEDINNWYTDMTKYGLNENEQECLKKYLSDAYGLADSQEKVMLLSMDKESSGFTLKESNKLRKAIAKKKEDVLEQTKTLFFDSCLKQGTRDVFAKYTWEEIFAMSFGLTY